MHIQSRSLQDLGYEVIDNSLGFDCDFEGYAAD